MPVADRLGIEVAGAEAVLVEERQQRLDDEQRLALVARRVLGGADDVVGRDGVAHEGGG